MVDQAGSAATGVGSSALLNSSPAPCMNFRVLEDGSFQLRITPCRHTSSWIPISSVHGREVFRTLNSLATDQSHSRVTADSVAGETSSSPMITGSSRPSSPAGSGAAPMDVGPLGAATSGDADKINPGMLLWKSPQENTCLHIAAMHGHESFCRAAIAQNRDLLSDANMDGETPLVTAVTSGHAALASVLLGCCCEPPQMSEAILMQDKGGCNALHHALRGGHRELALELIEAEPALSEAVNIEDESPIFIAAMRDLKDVVEKLLESDDSAHQGTRGYNALHAAVCNGNADIAQRIVEKRSFLAKEENMTHMTPVHKAVYENKIPILKLFLDRDRSFGYLITTTGAPLLCVAAFVGHVDAARLLLDYCPDAPFRNTTKGWTCLHTAVFHGQTEFVEFILQSQQLRKLINMRDAKGETALHFAVRERNPKMVAALVNHRDIDVTMFSKAGQTATWVLLRAAAHAKTLNWNEVYMLLLKADPKIATSTDILHGAVKDEVTKALTKDVKILSEKYRSNTSVVAILIASITFAAAFTLPGGNSNSTGTEGHPIMVRKLAFQAFLISDILAMCSSLAVAFVCVVAPRWEDLEFLLYYRSSTKKLMWLAYIATTTAFTTGLYTVLNPRLPWLAVAVCPLTVLVPVLTMLLGEWPIWKLRIRLGENFKSELLDKV